MWIGTKSDDIIRIDYTLSRILVGDGMEDVPDRPRQGDGLRHRDDDFRQSQGFVREIVREGECTGAIRDLILWTLVVHFIAYATRWSNSRLRQ